jgi:serine protease AprX
MPDPVIAEVVVRSPDGTSILDAPTPLDAETIARYRPSADALRDAANRLGERGFAIVQEGPTSITISADRELFERTFSTSPGAETGAPAQIPPDLADVVAAVTFPRPPELHP